MIHPNTIQNPVETDIMTPKNKADKTMGMSHKVGESLLLNTLKTQKQLRRGNTNMTSQLHTSRLGRSDNTSSMNNNGVKNLEKRLVIFKKEIEKMIKDKKKEDSDKLSKSHKSEIKDMIKKQSGVGGEKLQALKEKVELNIGMNKE